MVSPELSRILDPESLQRWKSTKTVSAPYAGRTMEQETQLLNEHINHFVSIFKSTPWMSDGNSCAALNLDIRELTRLLKSRKANISEMQNIPFLKGDIFFCQEAKRRAEEVKVCVDYFKNRHPSTGLRTLSAGLTKLIGKFDKEIDQDNAMMKASLTKNLQDAIKWAYGYSTRKSPEYLLESLGMTLGTHSSDNRALAAALKTSHQNLRDTPFFNQTLTAVQLMVKAFNQRGDPIPAVLEGKLAGVRRELTEMYPKHTQVWLLRKTIHEAYNHYSSNYHSRILEQSLGRHFGANSSENRELREILHNSNLENLPDEKIIALTERAIELIRKGFKQMEEPIPRQLAQQMKALRTA